MKNVKLLDCTLRDGARIINCEVPDKDIKKIISRLTESHIDYVEVGFLRDHRKLTYKHGSTFFTSVKQIEPFIDVDTKSNTKYLAFVDYGMFDFDSLDECDGKSVDGIRVGFTKGDYEKERKNLLAAFEKVKQKGYMLFIQGVNSLGYTDSEILELCGMLNEIMPYGFGIVDTYGSMYLEDVDRIYSIVNHNLDKRIAIDFHAHNNRQMAFALSQEVMRLDAGRREIIIDATLEGMGKCAGNLNIELMVDLLTKKHKYDYNFDLLLDTIDECLFEIKQNHEWGYTVPNLMGGIYQTHPNNVLYLNDKFRLNNKDIKNIVSMIEQEKKHHYDYDYLENLYLEYSESKIDDSKSLEFIKDTFNGKSVLILAPGRSIIDFKADIDKFAEEEKPIIVSVNFISGYKDSFAFFGNKKRYENTEGTKSNERLIATTNVTLDDSKNKVINFYSLIDRRYKMYDNSVMMLLSLLNIAGVKKITLAGCDGYSETVADNYFDSEFGNNRHRKQFGEINYNVGGMLSDFINKVSGRIEVKFLTPSIYQQYIK